MCLKIYKVLLYSVSSYRQSNSGSENRYYYHYILYGKIETEKLGIFQAFMNRF